MSFEIVVAAGTDRHRDCHVEIDGTAFPAAPWRDRPAVILAWWIENHLEMRRSGAPAHNSFMEGPYEFTVMPAGDSLTIALIRHGLDVDEDIGRHSVEPRAYEAALVDAAEAATHGSDTEADLEVLVRNLEAMRRLLD